MFVPAPGGSGPGCSLRGMRRIVLWLGLVLLAAPQAHAEAPLSPRDYQRLLGVGVDADWAKTPRGMRYYSREQARAFKEIGFDHVRLRVREEATPELLDHLERVVKDALSVGLVPIVAYQAAYFKEDPSPQNRDRVVAWWRAVAGRFQGYPPELSFDLIIEVTDRLNREPGKLLDLYRRTLAEVRKTNPTRIAFVSPRLRSAPEHLHELDPLFERDPYLMAEWHFYASGPSKHNPRKKWTSGTPEEKRLILDKIEHALAWQRSTGHHTWVGAWMPGNYNKGDSYSIPEQAAFAAFVSCALREASIPFAINQANKFYDEAAGRWREAMLPVVEAVVRPRCP